MSTQNPRKLQISNMERVPRLSAGDFAQLIAQYKARVIIAVDDNGKDVTPQRIKRLEEHMLALLVIGERDDD